MQYEIQEEHEKRLMVIRTHGRADVEGFEDYTRESRARAIWGPGLVVLVDHRDLDLSSFSRRDVERYRDFCSELFTAPDTDNSAKIRIASVVADGIGYGVARQWEIPLRGDLSFVHRTFLSYSEAVNWLGVAVEDEDE